MSPHLPIRVAAGFTLLLGAGHQLGMPWTPDRSAGGLAEVAQMQAHQFELQSFSRSYWVFYQGFGVFCTITMVALAVLLWQLAGLAKASAATVRPFITSMLLAFIAFLAAEWFYLFAAPLVLTAPIVASLAVAWFGVRNA